MLKMMTFSIILLMWSLISMLIAYYLIMMNKMIIIEWLILNLNNLKFNMFLMIDNKTMFFIMMVSLITSMVLIYSIEYMNLNIKLMNKFLYLIMLFYLSMILMIISPNMLTIMLGWDGLGLISYCLIIYYNNMKAYSAGFLTVILNRIGDICLLMLICMMMKFNSWNLLLYNMNLNMFLLLIIMAFTKSAQIPFSSWLPAAMMAPTPVSSLVHSSTLVTAGVYLLIRYNSLIFEMKLNKYLLIISSLTMFTAGFMALFEIDLKKIIALSTLSQLGFMMSILFLGLEDLAFFHLIIHAMFKSLMFLCSGSFIHYMSGSQDMRDYSGMMLIYPFKSLIMIFSILSLCGFPFLCGFYSKDLIMEYFFYNKLNFLSFMNLALGTIFTVSYSTRLILTLFFKNMPFYNNLNFKESKIMNFSMLIMFLMSLFFSKIYTNLMYLNYNIQLPNLLKLLILKLCLIGIILGYKMFSYNKKFNYFMLMSKNMMFMNNFYKNNYKLPIKFIFKYEKYIEKSLFEMFMGKLMIQFLYMLNMMKFNFFSFNFMISSMIMNIFIIFMII